MDVLDTVADPSLTLLVEPESLKVLEKASARGSINVGNSAGEDRCKTAGQLGRRQLLQRLKGRDLVGLLDSLERTLGCVEPSRVVRVGTEREELLLGHVGGNVVSERRLGILEGRRTSLRDGVKTLKVFCEPDAIGPNDDREETTVMREVNQLASIDVVGNESGVEHLDRCALLVPTAVLEGEGSRC